MNKIIITLSLATVLFGQLSFTSHTITTNADYATSVFAIDIDNDGYQDVIIADRTSTKFYKNDTHSNFKLQDSLIGFFAPALGVNDFDNDGYDDLLIMGFILNGDIETIDQTRVYFNNTLDLTVEEQNGQLISNEIAATYHWVDCNNENEILEFENDQILESQTAGDFAVIVSKNGCIDTTECYSISPIANIYGSINGKTTIYPNPSSGLVTINITEAPTANVNIFDSYGRLINSQEVDNTNHQIQLPDTTGLYILEVNYNETKAIYKVFRK